MVAVVAFVVGCNTLAGRLAVRANNRAPRNPDTGILIGAEPRDLGPVDAPVAVLFVHGFVGAGNNFADLPDRVAAEGSRVRVMRLPGHGTSPHDLKRVTADELLMAVFGEIEALRAGPRPGGARGPFDGRRALHARRGGDPGRWARAGRGLFWRDLPVVLRASARDLDAAHGAGRAVDVQRQALHAGQPRRGEGPHRVVRVDTLQGRHHTHRGRPPRRRAPKH